MEKQIIIPGTPRVLGGNSIAQEMLRSGMSVSQLRTLTPLPENAQKLIDDAVVRVGLQRLSVAAEVMAEGLTYSLPDPLSVAEIQWEQISKSGGAYRTMNPEARGENQLQDRRPKRVPIYCTIDDFSLGIRTLRTSQRVGAPIDTSLVEDATRRVNESIEDAFINGAALAVDGYSAYGLLNAPNANTYAYATGMAWDNASKTGALILADVQAMALKLVNDKKFGPYTLFIPTSYNNALDADFKANGDLTIRQRLEQLTYGGRNLKIVVADQLGTDRTALVQMTSDVIQAVRGQDPTVIPWTSPSGFTLYWLVMAIIVPRIRDDYDGNSGICLGYTS
jgi:hypothetical protein